MTSLSFHLQWFLFLVSVILEMTVLVLSVESSEGIYAISIWKQVGNGIDCVFLLFSCRKLNKD